MVGKIIVKHIVSSKWYTGGFSGFVILLVVLPMDELFNAIPYNSIQYPY